MISRDSGGFPPQKTHEGIRPLKQGSGLKTKGYDINLPTSSNYKKRSLEIFMRFVLGGVQGFFKVWMEALVSLQFWELINVYQYFITQQQGPRNYNLE